VLAAATSVFAVGGALRSAQCVVAVIAAASLACTVLSRRRFQRWPLLLILFVTAVAWSLIQWVPLPAGLVAALSPSLDALRTDGAKLAGIAADTTFTVDTPATLRAVTYFVTLSALAVVSLRLSIGERGRYWLVSTVAAIAGAAAIVSGVHELFGATSLYGIYEPRQLPPILGPLINPNHLGCLMALGAIASVGLAFYGRQRLWARVGWIINGGSCVIVTLATYSRGAVLGLAVGTAAALAVLVAQKVYASELNASRRRRERFFRTTLPIGVTVACALFLAVFLSGGSVVGQLQATSLDELHAPRTKYAAWVSSMELVRESPWVGTGRGAFESAFTRVHPASAYATFTHPENALVQAVVEWGIPVTVVLAVIAGWMTLVALRRWKDGPLAAGAIGALLAVGFQSNFDFGIELLGVAIPSVLLLATLTYVPLVEIAPGQRRRTLARIGHVAVVLAGAAALLSPMTRTLDEDHELLRNTPSPSDIAASVAAHPLDYLGYAVLADERFHAAAPEGVRILNHALRLHPSHSDLHWIAARLLVRGERFSQAESEYSTAIRYASNPRPIISELVRVLPADRAARAIPFEMPLDRTLRELPTEVAGRWLRLVFAHTHDFRAAQALYSYGVRAKSWEIAVEGARYRCKLMPSTRCTFELATVLDRAGRHAEVVQLLNGVAEWQGRREDQLQAWRMLCQSYASLGNSAEAASCSRRLDASGLEDAVR